MRTRILLGLVIATAAAAVAAPAANADHFCGEIGVPGTYQVVDIAGQAYLTIDEVAGEEYLFSIWGYLETNGEANLQRGGVTLLGDADICQESLTPDQGVF